MTDVEELAPQSPPPEEPAKNEFVTRYGFAIGWILCFLLIQAYFFLQIVPLLGTAGTNRAGLASHANDYKHVYLGSIMMAEGLSPYDPLAFLTLAQDYASRDPRFGSINPYVYLPFTGFVMRPLTLLPFSRSVVALQFLNHACLLGGIVLVLTALRRLTPLTLALALATITFNITVFRQNNAGQLNAVIFAGYALVLVGLMRNWPAVVIGFIAAFLTLFKLSPGILLIWFLARKEWLRAGWMVTWLALLTLLNVAVYGMKVHLEFLPILQDMGYGKSTWSQFGATFWRDVYNQSFNSLFHRVLVPDLAAEGATSAARLANALTWAASLSVLGALAVFAFRTRGVDSRLPESYSLAVVASLLLPSILWDHYLVQAILPLLVLFTRGRVATIVVAAACFAIIAAPVTFHSEFFQTGIGVPLMNLKLLPLLAMFLALMALAPREAEPKPA